MTEKPISLWHCMWGAFFLVLGLALFIYVLIHNLAHTTDSLTQVVAPGKAELTLQHGRTYTVFLEEQSVINGKVYSTTDSISGLVCRVNNLQDNSIVAMQNSSMNSSYSLNQRSGHSIFEFPIQEDGKYEFACDYGDNTKGPEVVLAVGNGVIESIFLTVAEGLVSMFSGFGACLTVVLIVLVKRSKQIKNMRQVEQVANMPPPLN